MKSLVLAMTLCINNTMAANSDVVAEKQPSKYQYHGVTFEDPYQWMEKTDNQSKLNRFLKQKGEQTAKRLAQLPDREKLFKQAKQYHSESLLPFGVKSAGGKMFYLLRRKDHNGVDLWVKPVDGKPQLVVDQVYLKDQAKQHVSIDNFEPSPDGSLVAVNLASKGNELSQVKVINSKTNQWLDDDIPRIWGEFSVTWMPDGKSFFYTQMVEDGFKDKSVDILLNMQVYHHRLGDDLSNDKAVLGTRTKARLDLQPREFPMIFGIGKNGYVLGVAGGARLSLKMYVTTVDQLLSDKPQWNIFSSVEDAVLDAKIIGDELYFIQAKDTPNGELRKVALATPSIGKSSVVVPESDIVLKSLKVAKDGLYITRMDTGVDTLALLPKGGNKLIALSFPVKGRISAVVTSPERLGAWVMANSWLESPRFYHNLQGKKAFVAKSLIGQEQSVKPKSTQGLMVERVMVAGFDKAEVPMWILRHKDTPLDGKAPTIVGAYGGYGITIRPFFLKQEAAWLHNGGIMVFVNVRGGGAKGRAWYLDGKGKNKYKGFNDVVSAAEYLIAKGYSSKKQLFLNGTSQGGLLMGGVLNLRPDLFAGATINVGLLNPLRMLEGTNGANQIDELGNVAQKAGFEDLRAMDPYVNLDKNKRYPPVMLNIGLNDNRVPVWHSAKYGAKLQEISGKKHHVVYRVDSAGGHGVGATVDQDIYEEVDKWLFYLHLAKESK